MPSLTTLGRRRGVAVLVTRGAAIVATMAILTAGAMHDDPSTQPPPRRQPPSPS